MEPRKATLFPRTFEYCYVGTDGQERFEDAALFGDLVQAVELAADLEDANPEDPDGLWTRPVPDMAPGTNAQRGLPRRGIRRLERESGEFS